MRRHRRIARYFLAPGEMRRGAIPKALLQTLDFPLALLDLFLSPLMLLIAWRGRR